MFGLQTAAAVREAAQDASKFTSRLDGRLDRLSSQVTASTEQLEWIATALLLLAAIAVGWYVTRD